MAKKKHPKDVCAYSKCEELFTSRNEWHKCHHWSCAMAFKIENDQQREKNAIKK